MSASPDIEMEKWVKISFLSSSSYPVLESNLSSAFERVFGGVETVSSIGSLRLGLLALQLME